MRVVSQDWRYFGKGNGILLSQACPRMRRLNRLPEFLVAGRKYHVAVFVAESDIVFERDDTALFAPRHPMKFVAGFSDAEGDDFDWRSGEVDQVLTIGTSSFLQWISTKYPTSALFVTALNI